MYRAHCQRVLDSIIRTNFEEVQTLLHHFWNQIPHHLLGILTNPQLLNAIAVCDIRLYGVILRLTQSSISQTTLSESSLSQLEEFINNFENAINSALYYSHKHLNSLRHVKCRLGQLFSTIMADLLTFAKNCPFKPSDNNFWENFKTIFQTFELEPNDILNKYENLLSKMCSSEPPDLSLLTRSGHDTTTPPTTQDMNSNKSNVSAKQTICKHLLHFLMSPTGFDNIWEWFDAILSILTHSNLTLNHHHHQQQSNGSSSNMSLERHFLALWTLIRSELSNMRWSNAQLNRCIWSGQKVSEGKFLFFCSRHSNVQFECHTHTHTHTHNTTTKHAKKTIRVF